MHISEKLQQDLSYTDLCNLVYEGDFSLGWFGGFYVSSKNFEGSENIDVITTKVLDQSKADSQNKTPLSLKERINSALCIERICDHYAYKHYFIDHASPLHLLVIKIAAIFETFVEEIKSFFLGVNPTPRNLESDIDWESRYPRLLKLTKTLYEQEYPNIKSPCLFDFFGKMTIPLETEWVLKHKDKDWIKANVPRKAILYNLGSDWVKRNY